MAPGSQVHRPDYFAPVSDRPPNNPTNPLDFHLLQIPVATGACIHTD